MSNNCVNFLYQQERALGSTPSEMMDRDKAFIPAQQIGFMDCIAAPVFK